MFEFYSQLGFERVAVDSERPGDIVVGPNHIGIVMLVADSSELIVCHASGEGRGELRGTELRWLLEQDDYRTIRATPGFVGPVQPIETGEPSFTIQIAAYSGSDLKGPEELQTPHVDYLARLTGESRIVHVTLAAKSVDR